MGFLDRRILRRSTLDWVERTRLNKCPLGCESVMCEGEEIIKMKGQKCKSL